MDITAILDPIKIGFFHLFSINAIKHLLFLFVVLLASDFKNWKVLFSNISYFTIGVFVALLLSHYHIVHIKSSIVTLILWLGLATLSVLKIINVNKGAPTAFLIGILGMFHGTKLYHLFHLTFHQKQIFTPSLFYSLGIEIAAICFVVLATGIIYLISALSKTSKNHTESILNTLCLLISIYFIANYFIS
ncbi:HupE/UreJ family protein [Wenyingzhuangia sp. IMCC45533]